MAGRTCPAWPCRSTSRDARSPRWKGWRTGVSCIPSRSRLPNWAPRSAGIARRRCCSPPGRCSTGTPTQPETRSRMRFPAYSAAAPVTSRSSRPSNSRPREASAVADDLAVVGKSLTKPDAFAKVSGQTRFADDLALPRMLFGRILRSPHPHARIVRVDTTRARALPGVLAVLTGDDLPIKFGILPVSQDEEALAREKVRYVGDPIAAAAAPDGKLTLWTSSQTPHYVHRALGKVLELPMSRIRVIATPNGGGFGGKSDIFSHELVAAKLAIVTGRPVKITLTHEEVFYAHRGRHPVLMKVKTGLTKDGHITAMQFRSFLDGGGYGSYGVASTYYTGALQATTYAIPRYRFEGVRLFTNKPPCGPKRGHGTPQPRFALETHLDKVAEELGLDPVELRLRNLPRPDSRTVNWLRITSCGLEACISKVAEGSGFLERRRSMPRGRGLGFAVSSYLSGAGTAIYWNDMPHSEVQLKLDRNGGVALLCGAIDIGQGSDHIL